MDKCKDCGDVLGGGSFCRRCKWVGAGKPEEEFERNERARAAYINKHGKAHGWRVVELPDTTEGKA
jgi:hypothetical protein